MRQSGFRENVTMFKIKIAGRASLRLKQRTYALRECSFYSTFTTRTTEFSPIANVLSSAYISRQRNVLFRSHARNAGISNFASVVQHFKRTIFHVSSFIIDSASIISPFCIKAEHKESQNNYRHCHLSLSTTVLLMLIIPVKSFEYVNAKRSGTLSTSIFKLTSGINDYKRKVNKSDD